MKLENGMMLPVGSIFVVHSVGFFCGPKFYKDVYTVEEGGKVKIFGKEKTAQVEEHEGEFFTIEDDGMVIGACVFKIANKEIILKRIESLEEQVVKGCNYKMFEKSELKEQLEEHKKALKSLNIPVQLTLDKIK